MDTKARSTRGGQDTKAGTSTTLDVAYLASQEENARLIREVEVLKAENERLERLLALDAELADIIQHIAQQEETAST